MKGDGILATPPLPPSDGRVQLIPFAPISLHSLLPNCSLSVCVCVCVCVCVWHGHSTSFFAFLPPSLLPRCISIDRNATTTRTTSEFVLAISCTCFVGVHFSIDPIILHLQEFVSGCMSRGAS